MAVTGIWTLSWRTEFRREKSLGDLCIIQGKVNSDLKEWEVIGRLKRGDRSSNDASWWQHMAAEKEIGVKDFSHISFLDNWRESSIIH